MALVYCYGVIKTPFFNSQHITDKNIPGRHGDKNRNENRNESNKNSNENNSNENSNKKKQEDITVKKLIQTIKSIHGFEDKNLDFISWKEVTAVVSSVSEPEFSQQVLNQKVKEMTWLTNNCQMHENVVEAVMERTTIIPMKFCTIFQTNNAVVAMLKEKYADLSYALSRLNGKVEMGIKVYYEEEDMRKEMLAMWPELKKLEEEAHKKPPGQAYMAQQKIEMLVKDKIQARLQSLKQQVYPRLAAISITAKNNPLLKKSVTKKNMLLNSVFLTSKKEVEAFKNKVNLVKKELVKKEETTSLEFAVWGPFPPYNFIT